MCRRVSWASRRARWRVLAVWLLPVGLAGCEPPPPPVEEVVRSVKTVVVEERASARQRQIAGSLAAVRRAALSFPVPGTVREVLVEQGSTVVAGEVLARLDDEVYRLAVAAAQAQLSSARASAEEARADFSRQSALLEKNIVARAAVDRSRAALQTSRAQVRAAESEVARARRDLQRTAVLAPFDGTVAERSVEPYQEVAAGAVVLVVDGRGGLEAEVLVPEGLVRHVAHGDAVRVDFPTVPGTEVGGVVVEIGNRTEAGNALPVTVRLGPGQDEVPLRPGMTARVTFDLAADADEAGFLVPLSAIAFGQGKRREEPPDAGTAPRAVPMFVHDPAAGVVRKVEVTVGDLRGNRVEVYSGLEAGDRVAVAGVAFLRDGMPVRLWQPDL